MSDEARYDEQPPTHRSDEEGGELWANETRERTFSTATARVQRDRPSPRQRKFGRENDAKVKPNIGETVGLRTTTTRVTT